MQHTYDTATYGRLRGILAGLATGDALGALYEFKDSLSLTGISPLKMRSINGTTGIWTDDTAMALCLADSLIACRGYDSYDVMERYWRWLREGYRTYYSFGEGVGGQTLRSIKDFSEKDPVVSIRQERSNQAGNGAIMRLAPIILATYNRHPIAEIIHMARISARETHYSVEAEVSTEIFAAMLHEAIRKPNKSQVIDVSKYSTGETYTKILQRVLNPPNKHADLTNLGGYIIDTIRIAIWGLATFDNFLDGMNGVIRLGGDTDTNAAVYGQLAGAYYGYSSIPSYMISDLYLRDEILNLTERLIEMPNAPIRITRFEEDVSYGYFRG